jgi:hypothetical protein
VSFIVNRSTDFFGESEDFSALRAEVSPAVVVRHVVSVVNFALGPFAGHVEPCKLMRIVVPPIDLDSAGAITTN